MNVALSNGDPVHLCDLILVDSLEQWGVWVCDAAMFEPKVHPFEVAEGVGG